MAYHEAAQPKQKHPARPAWSVEQARNAFLAENGFTLEAYEAPWTPAEIIGIRFKVPNTPRHRWAIRLHDLHHVALGYGTDLMGEAETAAWECRSGLGPLGLYTGAIVLSLALLGLVLAPRRTVWAWRRSQGLSLFHVGKYRYAELLLLSVVELRSLVGIPPAGLAEGTRRTL